MTTPTDDPDDFTIGDNPDTEELSPSEQRLHLLVDSINDQLEFKMSLETSWKPSVDDCSPRVCLGSAESLDPWHFGMSVSGPFSLKF